MTDSKTATERLRELRAEGEEGGRMITVEDLLMAFASAYDAWLDPDAERKNPVPEYAALIRQAVNYENNTLGRGECEMEPLNAFFTTVNQLDQTVWGVCSNCGTASPIDATYCCECGRKVKR